MDVRMCECIVCMKEKLIKLSDHQTYKKNQMKRSSEDGTKLTSHSSGGYWIVLC
jgi:hypothetical protein